MKNKITAIVASAYILFGLSSCVMDFHEEHSRDYHDSEKWGKLIREELNLKDFCRLDINQTIDVVFTQSDTFSVVVEGNEMAIPYYNFVIDSVNGDAESGYTLLAAVNHEKRDKNEFFLPAVRLHVKAPNLTFVELNGIGDFDIKESASFDDLTLRNYGTGDMDIKTLRTNNLIIETLSTGDLNIRNLKANSLNVRTEGTGDVELRKATVADKAEFLTSGTGDIDATISANTIVATSTGTGDIDLDVECEELEAVAKGTGDVEISGSARVLRKQKHGLASVITKHLHVEELKKY